MLRQRVRQMPHARSRALDDCSYRRWRRSMNPSPCDAVYGRTDMPEDFAYAVAKAMDVDQDKLQWNNVNLSYNTHTVWKAFGVPLHPGAARYYKERGYLQ